MEVALEVDVCNKLHLVPHTRVGRFGLFCICGVLPWPSLLYLWCVAMALVSFWLCFVFVSEVWSVWRYSTQSSEASTSCSEDPSSLLYYAAFVLVEGSIWDQEVDLGCGDDTHGLQAWRAGIPGQVRVRRPEDQPRLRLLVG